MRVLEGALSAPDRHILSAGTVAQATELLAAYDVALVVLDLFLPDDDGRHLLSWLRQQRVARCLGSSCWQAGSGLAVKAECFRLGAAGYFEKPVDLAALAHRRARSPGEHRRRGDCGHDSCGPPPPSSGPAATARHHREWSCSPRTTR